MNLADLFSAIATAKRRAGDMAQAPGANIQQLIGSVQDAWRNIQSQPAPTSLAPEQGDVEKVLEAVMNFAPVGMLRAGGRPDLMHYHSTSNLGRMLEDTRPKGGVAELYAPSFAITKDRVDGAFGSTILIPKVGAFDPQTYPSTLFNRDAYTPRYNDFPGRILSDEMFDPKGNWAAMKAKAADPNWRPTGAASDRLLDRFGTRPENLRLKEGGDASFGMDPSHRDAINASPHFRSFAEYEKSPYGAGVLKGTGNAADEVGMAMENYRNFAESPTGSKLFSEGLAKGFIPLPRGISKSFGSKDALEYSAYRENMRRLPSGYAELKMTGAVPLTGEHFAGALLSRDANLYNKEIKQYLDKNKIPFQEYSIRDSLPKGDNVWPTSAAELARGREQHLFELADMLQRLGGPARRQPVFPGEPYSGPPSRMPQRPAPSSAKPELPWEPLQNNTYGSIESYLKLGVKLMAKDHTGKLHPVNNLEDAYMWGADKIHWQPFLE